MKVRPWVGALTVAVCVATAAVQGQARHGETAGDTRGGGLAVELSEQERRWIDQQSPLGPPPPSPTNAVADDPAAASLGQLLFFDPGLSVDGAVSCASCHRPERGWSSGEPLTRGARRGRLHVPTLLNVAYQRWFFWDGRADSLWAQALEPLEGEGELAGDRMGLVHRVRRDAALRASYEAAFGPLPDLGDRRRFPPRAKPLREDPDNPLDRAWRAMDPRDRDRVDRIFSDLGKAIEAYERLLVRASSPFDRFAEGLRRNDPEGLAALSPAAQRGLKTFLGRGQCRLCHSGPSFSDGEFHRLRVPERSSFEDMGRYRGIHRLRRNPFNGAGAYSDAPDSALVRFLPEDTHETLGQMKTPTLRNVAETAPYMHNGRMAALEDVVRFYSTGIDPAPVVAGQEQILTPLRLTEGEIADLVAFLRSLTGETLAIELTQPQPSAVASSAQRSPRRD